VAKIIDFPAIYKAMAEACAPVSAQWRQYLYKIGINQATIDHVGLRMCGQDYPEVIEKLRQQFDDEALVEADVIFDPLFEEDDDEIKGTFAAYYKAGLEFLVIPYVRNNRTVFLRARPLCNRKQLASLKVPTSLGTGASPAPFNMDAMTPDATIFFCRGEIPTMVGISRGLRILGISRWERFKQIWVHWFKDAMQIRLIVDSGDSDTQKGLPRVAEMFKRAGIAQPKPVKLPKGMDFATFFDAVARRHGVPQDAVPAGQELRPDEAGSAQDSKPSSEADTSDVEVEAEVDAEDESA